MGSFARNATLRGLGLPRFSWQSAVWSKPSSKHHLHLGRYPPTCATGKFLGPWKHAIQWHLRIESASDRGPEEKSGASHCIGQEVVGVGTVLQGQDSNIPRQKAYPIQPKHLIFEAQPCRSDPYANPVTDLGSCGACSLFSQLESLHTPIKTWGRSCFIF